MHRLSVDNLMPLLSSLQQPAFCIRTNGTLAYNDAAKYLIPACAADLPDWLGNGKALYDAWDRTDKLQLPLTVSGHAFSVCIQKLLDGTLFLMSACDISEDAEHALAVTSQVLRQPLADLVSVVCLAEDTAQPHNGALWHHLYRLSRLTANLTEIVRLSSTDPKLYLSATDTDQLLLPLTEEVAQLCRQAGRELIAELPKKPLNFFADTVLLKRAILNLMSNAIKFSTPGTPIILRAEAVGTHLLLQLENSCSDDGSDLLRNAFNRLSQRGLLPDPRWGVGLGLPLANAIARLHGGMVAVETPAGKAIVSISVSRQKAPDGALASGLMPDYTGGMRQTLLELSDVLPAQCFEN